VWALGPVAVACVFDRSGGYTVPFRALAGILAAAAGAILMAGRRALAMRASGALVADPPYLKVGGPTIAVRRDRSTVRGLKGGRTLWAAPTNCRRGW
jgi:hypothetical protein